MASLLRRMWSSARSSSSSSSSSRDERRASNASAGSCSSSSSIIEALPEDVLLLVFTLLSARDLAAASLVCRQWYSIAMLQELWQHHLVRANTAHAWPFVQFAEASLRAGPPLIGSVASEDLSFHQLFSSRMRKPCSVIIDGGSGYCKYGWGNSDKPCGRFPTFMAFGNIETPMYVSLKDFYATVFDHLLTKPSSQPVVISTPICHNDDTNVAVSARRNFRHVTYKVLFDMGVRAVCAVDQAILALYAARQTSGIVVNIGFQATSVVPVLHGKIMRNAGVEFVGLGALNLTAYLHELMKRSGIRCDNITVVKALKEKLCYVAQNYTMELSKNTEALCRLQNVGEFRLNHERFKTTEILFQPQLGGLHTMSLQQAVALCMEHCAQVTLDESLWYRNIVLCGGSACLPGLAERLKDELCRLLPVGLREHLAVFPPQHGPESAWFGAKLLSNLSSFQEAWCITKKEFQRHGQSILDKTLDES